MKRAPSFPSTRFSANRDSLQRSPTSETAYPVVIMPTPTPRRRSSGHRSLSLTGETLFKDHPSHEIMGNIQMGIKYSLDHNTPGSGATLPKSAFAQIHVTPFPSAGSKDTVGHKMGDFHFKEFAPQVFAEMRHLVKLLPDDYATSIVPDFSLREISTPGKSGALFYKTLDDRLLIKTVTKMETKKLMQILPAYYAHILDHHSTLLPRFLQLFRITTSKGRRIRMLVMFNILPLAAGINERFDLKGSTVGRASPNLRNQSTSKQHLDFINMRTMKDLDFVHLNRAIHLPAEQRRAVMEQLTSDATLLEGMNLMDYSLLLGIRRLSDTEAIIQDTPRQRYNAHVLVGTDQDGKPIEVHFGIIDILCRYTITKQAETAYKSIRFGAGIASATSPSRYSNRFVSFVGSVVFV